MDKSSQTYLGGGGDASLFPSFDEIDLGLTLRLLASDLTSTRVADDRLDPPKNGPENEILGTPNPFRGCVFSISDAADVSAPRMNDDFGERTLGGGAGERGIFTSSTFRHPPAGSYFPS